MKSENTLRVISSDSGASGNSAVLFYLSVLINSSEAMSRRFQLKEMIFNDIYMDNPIIR